ncbi:hypothetical protein AIT98_004198 [Salmonella enterica subsp. indica]|uniref:hypothetical protein n=1 Tax=Salmonella enterica TaxID=28901 RepID=UPI00159128ED|nr:hypothetical protein [Salmonella enterica]HBC0062807.1 hypothetical protein [Salmonella enterica]HCL5303469.1 hypothetical protein [Salmonella enterica]
MPDERRSLDGKTEGDYISPASYILDTPLLGHECITLQLRLARSLRLPPPKTGHCNTHCGILVCDGADIFQLVECCSPDERINQQLQRLSPTRVEYYKNKLNKQRINRHRYGYFPLYQFPADAWFVIKRAALDQFIHIFLNVLINRKENLEYQPLYHACCGWPVNIMTTSVSSSIIPTNYCLFLKNGRKLTVSLNI